MIDNPNPNNFYSDIEMTARGHSIPKIKADLLLKLSVLRKKIRNEEPFPEGNICLDDLVEFDDAIEGILTKWHY